MLPHLVQLAKDFDGACKAACVCVYLCIYVCICAYVCMCTCMIVSNSSCVEIVDILVSLEHKSQLGVPTIRLLAVIMLKIHPYIIYTHVYVCMCAYFLYVCVYI